MADKFYAATRIKYGKDIPHKSGDPTIPDKHETQWFEVGDEVTGLDKEEMQKLWNAGALERREGEATERAAIDQSGTGTGADTGVVKSTAGEVGAGTEKETKSSSASESKSSSTGQGSTKK